jgi:hypothetical protein
MLPHLSYTEPYKIPIHMIKRKETNIRSYRNYWYLGKNIQIKMRYVRLKQNSAFLNQWIHD